MTSQKNPPTATGASTGASQPEHAPHASGKTPAKPVQSELDAAHNRYFQTLQEAWQDMQKRLLEQQRGFQSTYQGIVQGGGATLMQDAQSNLLKAQQDYTRAYQDCGEATVKAAGDAYKEYVRSIQRALGSLDLEQLEPRLLAALGQSLIMVANTAHQVRGNKA